MNKGIGGLFAPACVLMLSAATFASAIAAEDFDGVYVGRPVSVSGACADVSRDFAISIDGSDAKMVFDIHGGRMLQGHVNSKGVVRMSLDSGTAQVNFEGKIDGGKLVGTTIGNASATGPCTFSWDMSRQ